MDIRKPRKGCWLSAADSAACSRRKQSSGFRLGRGMVAAARTGVLKSARMMAMRLISSEMPWKNRRMKPSGINIFDGHWASPPALSDCSLIQ